MINERTLKRCKDQEITLDQVSWLIASRIPHKNKNYVYKSLDKYIMDGAHSLGRAALGLKVTTCLF